MTPHEEQARRLAEDMRWEEKTGTELDGMRITGLLLLAGVVVALGLLGLFSFMVWWMAVWR